MAKGTKEPVFVAVDGGSGNIALRFTDDSGKEVIRISKSLVHPGLLQQGLQESLSTWRTDNGSIFSVADDATGIEMIDTCDPSYQISDAHRVLVLDALVKAGLGGRDVVIAETLPADQYYGAKGVNHERISEKKASLMRPITSYTGQVEPPRVKAVVVYPEAVTAFVSASELDDGSTRPEFDGVQRCVIVDLGRFTDDVAIVSADLDVQVARTSENGIQVMVNRLHQLLQEKQDELGLKEAKEISLAALDDFIERGYIGSQAQARAHLRKDIKPLVIQAAEELANYVASDVRKVIRNASNIDMVLFVGGGANWLGGKLSYVPNYAEQWHDYVYIPDEPQFAVVNGVYKLLMGNQERILAELNAEA